MRLRDEIWFHKVKTGAYGQQLFSTTTLLIVFILFPDDKSVLLRREKEEKERLERLERGQQLTPTRSSNQQLNTRSPAASLSSLCLSSSK